MPYERQSSKGRRSDVERPDAQRERPARAERGDEWIASQAAKTGVVHRESVGALQRTIGNARVQRLISVQRAPNQLEDSDIDPELREDLDSRFQLTEGYQLEEGAIDPGLREDLDSRFQLTEGNQLEEGDIDPELRKDLDSRFQLIGDTGTGGATQPGTAPESRLQGTDRTGRRPPSRGKGGIGKRMLKTLGKAGQNVAGFVRGVGNAYKKGGVHSQLTKRNRNLNAAKRMLKKGDVTGATPLAGKKGILEDAPTRDMLKIALTSPIVFARLVAENSKAKKIQKKLREMEEG